MGIETTFDVGLVAKLTAEEKQIQQTYRPVIGVHKWFARRPGALFRGLLLAEFVPPTLSTTYFQGHDLSRLTIADPFMGGGTTLFEANRLGCDVVGLDINPMAYWVVRQELTSIDRGHFRRVAGAVVADVESEIGGLYTTMCPHCQEPADVKYFLWVKRQRCGACGDEIDLFPGYQVARNLRHTHFVLYCPCCERLIEVETLPPKGGLMTCSQCSGRFEWSTGPAKRNRYRCARGHEGRYPAELQAEGPPRHRLFGIEYHCERCGPRRTGRLFKTADEADLEAYQRASQQLEARFDLILPDDAIPDGDETKRLHRWGYSKFREMFNNRQLLSLGLLMTRIKRVEEAEIRHALATVFSDALRYQNMLCRYDAHALKCQDIFSVHGFPVGLTPCENNVLGIPGVGSGAFRHFIAKYDRAKAYCERPFETVRSQGGKKRIVPTPGEFIHASLVSSPARLGEGRAAFLKAGSIEDVKFSEGTFDAVFTDPPYYNNVQYAELMDFCFAWLRLLLDDIEEFAGRSTRSCRELTGNVTQGRDLTHFTEGLSNVFAKAAAALKPGGPFVFTYHHNDLNAYVPLVVAILDAGLVCTATLPCPAEMGASLHISGTGSSTVDTVIVCRRSMRVGSIPGSSPIDLPGWLAVDRQHLLDAGVSCTQGDLNCLALGHLARIAVAILREGWSAGDPIQARMGRVMDTLSDLVDTHRPGTVIEDLLKRPNRRANDLASGIEAG